MFLVLFGDLCFVRSHVYLPFMQGLFGSVLCLACLVLFGVLSTKPVLFWVLFGIVCLVWRFVRDGVFCSALESAKRVLFGFLFGNARSVRRFAWENRLRLVFCLVHCVLFGA